MIASTPGSEMRSWPGLMHLHSGQPLDRGTFARSRSTFGDRGDPRPPTQHMGESADVVPARSSRRR